MITTKKGKDGRVQVMLSNSTSFSRPFVMPRFQNEFISAPGDVKSWGGTDGFSLWEVRSR